MSSTLSRTPRRALLSLAVALLALLLCAPVAGAQTLYAGVGGAWQGSVSADLWLRLEGVRPPQAAPTSLTFEVGGPAPRLGLGLSTNQSFGPLGNLVLEAWTALASHPDGGAAAEGSVAARGVIGPVALRLALLGYGADSGTFRPAELASAERPQFAGPAGGLQLSVTYRVNRDLILEAAPELYLTHGGLATRLDTGIRLLRLFGDNELRFDVHAYATPGWANGAVGVGAAVMFPRGREPDVTVGASVGYSANGLGPGVRVSLGERIGQVRLEFEGAFEPYRLDVPALRLTGGARLPVGGFLPQGTDLVVDAAFTSDLGISGSAGARAWLGTALAFPVDLR